MLIITGANGKLGRLVVQALLQHVPAAQIGVSVRDPEKARDLEERGVRVRRGDFSDAKSLTTAFEGASKVLIVSSNSSGAQAVQHHRAAIDAAKSASASHIFYTSHVGSLATSPFDPMRDHDATEALLRDSGATFTSLRNGFYADSVLYMLGDAVKTGQFAAPEDGPVSWTAHEDLAEATAKLLREPPTESGMINLTASEALDLEGIAAIASEIAGRRIRRLVAPDAEYRAGMVSRGVPEARADMMIGMFAASRQGQFARVDPTLARLLGRPPTSFRDVLKTAISAPH